MSPEVRRQITKRIFADSDLEAAAPSSMLGFCMLSGQVWCADTGVFGGELGKHAVDLYTQGGSVWMKL